LKIGAALDEDGDNQEDDGCNDEPELFLQGVLVMVMLMTFVVVMVLMGAALVVMMFM
jgi:hypothetical protein